MINEKFINVIEEMKSLHDKKNSNYASQDDFLSNFRKSEKIGVSPLKSCVVRMNDKYERMMNLLSGQEDLVNEPLRETLIDLAVYSVISILLLDEQNNKLKDLYEDKI